ncbi:MAG: squalene--hopene cyclase [Phycisphaerales bacterium]|nr:squalene--hopene cyclase [Phycisphaerae bacterium]NNF41742.1 squalene--hopene cyclase [Phycisphaerales bacterium]NNM26227.1 squalene--hopene cyclase [Phycisphaerales bacterium]
MTTTSTRVDRERLTASLSAAQTALLAQQRDDGHFCGELEGDSILESEYLLMKFILRQEHAARPDGSPGRATLEKIAEQLRRQQRPDGGWGQYPGSGVDLSATVKAYFALKLMGDDPTLEAMQAARAVIRANGGAEHCNSFTNFYLAALGQVPWSAVPAIPPEIVFLPRWSYFHLDTVSAWTRTMIMPLSIVATLQPTRRLETTDGIDELFIDEEERRRLTASRTPDRWSRFFLGIDRLLKIAGSGMPLRRIALRRVERWILARAGQDGPAATDGLGAIFPPMVSIQIALDALGYEPEHPARVRAEAELDALFIDDGTAIRIQPCFSPVWDTGIALYALTDCGMTEADEPACAAAAWLRAKECRHVGDWHRNVRGEVEPSGWYFEYHNAWYPDVDDTAMVAMSLRRTGGAANRRASARGVAWMLAMQNDDGGWAAFDRTRDRAILERIPFADHNAMQDPSCPDITGRVLECLAWHGLRRDHPAIDRAVAYIRSHQEPDGAFFGRWGVNYLYGTWQAVVGPVRCGIDPAEPWLERAGAWVRSVQQPDGGFGETANSYVDPAFRGQGPATASQTAWAAMTLLALAGPHDDAVERAMSWLMTHQLDERRAADPEENPDGDPAGSWAETQFTGTGFPEVFYLRYHLYRLYFPLMALGRYRAALQAAGEERPALKVRPKVVVG